MPGEWNFAELADGPVEIIDGDRGVNYPKQSDFLASGHCLFLNTGNVTPTGFNFSECSFVTKEKDNALRKGKLRRQDVVLTTRGTVGNVAFYDDVVPFENVRINSGMVLLRVAQNKLLPRFLYLFARSNNFKEQVASLSTGSAQPQLPIRDIKKVEIPIPPLSEQRAIASVLGALDDKVELNRRMNETLEALAQTLFKSWFVDFDPYLHTVGVTSVLPKGWIEMSLKEAAELITKGTTPTQNDIADAPISDEQINFLRVNAIADDGSILDDKLTKIPESVHSGVLKRSILKFGDVVYTIAGTIGRISVIENEILPANCNQAVAIIRPKMEIPTGFLLLWLKQAAFQEELHTNVVHAVQANLSLGMISKAKIVSPPLKILSEVFNPIENILKKIHTNRSESRTLAALRDALLPKLLSGELRVPVAGKISQASQERSKIFV